MCPLFSFEIAKSLVRALVSMDSFSSFLSFLREHFASSTGSRRRESKHSQYNRRLDGKRKCTSILRLHSVFTSPSTFFCFTSPGYGSNDINRTLLHLIRNAVFKCVHDCNLTKQRDSQSQLLSNPNRP